MIQSLLIANRGEIAWPFIRTARVLLLAAASRPNSMP